MLWPPGSHDLGEPAVVRAGQVYHLFAPLSPGPTAHPVIAHYTSRDLLRWEEHPPALQLGKPGEFDAWAILQPTITLAHGKWYLHYLGLDQRGPAQRRRIGLAISDDGERFTKHLANPILAPDPRWYEHSIPDEAAYQERDRGRCSFDNPSIHYDQTTAQYVMLAAARDPAAPPDLRACVAAATSDDLLAWSPQPPIFSPKRFHTIESPSIFAHAGRHYLLYTTRPDAAGPVIATDPYQDAGSLYAVSTTGWAGPYHPPKDEVLVAAHGQPRLSAQRTVDAPDGTRYLYGLLQTAPAPDDLSRHPPRPLIPSFKPLRFLPDGSMHAMFNPAIDKLARPAPMDLGPTLDGQRWRDDAGVIRAKDIRGRSVSLYPDPLDHPFLTATIRFNQGERAGLVMRADPDARTGWYALADRRYGRIEFGTLDGQGLIDARSWEPADEVELTVLVHGPLVEVYADAKLMIQQIRHRESTGSPGLIIEWAEASFENLRLRALPPLS